MGIITNVKQILTKIPENVDLVAAAKTRTEKEVLEAIEAGVKIIGESYVQESIDIVQNIGNIVRWHFIGHLQSNKVKYVVPYFDMIETVSSVKLAKEINKVSKKSFKKMSILVEVNSGREPQKNGVYPECTLDFIHSISELENIKIEGIMTMGPYFEDVKKVEPYFRETKKLFDKIKAEKITGVEMNYLSMGMSESFLIAIQNGANLVRIGTAIFGPRL